MRTIRSPWRAAARARSVSARPQPGWPPEHQHGVGVGVGHPVEGGHQRRHPLARLERADEDDERPVRPARRAPPSSGRSAPGAGSSGVKRSWSTPWGATTTGARTSQHACEPVGRDLADADQRRRRARAACRMARRKNAAFERRCHSGWSKNVQSWIVTAHGTGGACRHGVVRPVVDLHAERTQHGRKAELLEGEPARPRRRAPRPRTVAPAATRLPACLVAAAGDQGERRRRRARPGRAPAPWCSSRRHRGAPGRRRRRARAAAGRVTAATATSSMCARAAARQVRGRA